ncbi:Scr1 family TA system antitoxin-like transcriptional regulator [Amycolatopsis sp. NPDC004368]
MYFGEAAIRLINGGLDIWIDQLRYLLEMAEMPNIEFHYVPFDAGWSPIQGESFTVIESDTAPPVVNLEVGRSGLMLTAEKEVRRSPDSVSAIRERVECEAGCTPPDAPATRTATRTTSPKTAPRATSPRRDPGED